MKRKKLEEQNNLVIFTNPGTIIITWLSVKNDTYFSSVASSLVAFSMLTYTQRLTSLLTPFINLQCTNMTLTSTNYIHQ